MENTVNIRDFIVRPKDEHEAESQTKNKTERIVKTSGSSVKTTFHMDLQTGCDFVIRRENRRANGDITFSKTLAVLVSAEQFYIKDNLKDTIAPFPVAASVTNFLSGMDDDHLILELLNNITWIKIGTGLKPEKYGQLNASRAYALAKGIEQVFKNPFYLEACKRGIQFEFIDGDSHIEMRKRVFKEYAITAEDKDTFFEILEWALSFRNLEQQDETLRETFKIYLKYGKKTMNEFINAIKESARGLLFYSHSRISMTGIDIELEETPETAESIRRHPVLNNFYRTMTTLYSVIHRYELDPIKAVRYICLEQPQNGAFITRYSPGSNPYHNYLAYQAVAYGRVLDKYPAHLFTELNIAKMHATFAREMEDREVGERLPELKKLNYSSDDFMIIAPESIPEILYNLRILNQDVIRVYDEIIEKDLAVLFLRKPGRMKQPMSTVGIIENKVVYAKSENNESLSDGENAFLHEWARLNEIEIQG